MFFFPDPMDFVQISFFFENIEKKPQKCQIFFGFQYVFENWGEKPKLTSGRRKDKFVVFDFWMAIDPQFCDLKFGFWVRKFYLSTEKK